MRAASGLESAGVTPGGDAWASFPFPTWSTQACVHYSCWGLRASISPKNSSLPAVTLPVGSLPTVSGSSSQLFQAPSWVPGQPSVPAGSPAPGSKSTHLVLLPSPTQARHLLVGRRSDVWLVGWQGCGMGGDGKGRRCLTSHLRHLPPC